MKKGIGPRSLGSPLKQATKPKRKTKMDNVTLSPRQKRMNEALEAKKKRVAERESPERREAIDKRLGRIETTIKKKK